jgi:hypothetical protein
VLAAFDGRRADEVEALLRGHAIAFVAHLERCLQAGRDAAHGAGG